jgi:hypothetical protein
MSEPLLPPGIKVGSGLGLDEKPVVQICMTLVGGDEMTLVLPPHQSWALAMSLLDQDDRRIRALGGLILRQTRLCQEAAWRGLRVVGGSEA